MTEAKGISLKIFKSYDITREKLVDELKKYVEVSTQPSTSIQPLPFDDEYKEILKKSLDLATNQEIHTILYEHLFLSAISDKKSNNIKNSRRFRI